MVKDNVAVAGAGESEGITGLTPGVFNYIAVRFKLVGVYGAGYTASDPSLWPLGSQTAVLPAFGSFTGLGIVSPGPADRAFVIAESEVIEVQPVD